MQEEKSTIPFLLTTETSAVELPIAASNAISPETAPSLSIGQGKSESMDQVDQKCGASDKPSQVCFKACPCCDGFFEKMELSEHEFECWKMMEEIARSEEEDLVKCEDCDIKLTKSEYKFHQQACPMKLIECYRCSTPMIQCILEDHLLSCKPQSQCSVCNKNVPDNQFQEHFYACSKQTLKLEEQISKGDVMGGLNVCLWCLTEIGKYRDIKQHEQQCPDCIEHRHDMSALSKELTPLQLAAVEGLNRQSVKSHYQNLLQVKNKIFEMGYTEEDMHIMAKFIQIQAPIIIHFDMSKLLGQFVKDTRYRSLFQTNTSLGYKSKEKRKGWQKDLFGQYYDKAADQERVKYGVMNFVNDSKGVKSCQGYGSSYMVLNYEVRKRCTMSDKRKYAPGEIVSTLKYCNQVLSKFDNKQLQAIYFASKGFEVESQDLNYFKEVHIHGPIYFGRDIEIVYGPKQEIEKNKETVLLFQQTFGVPVRAIGENLM